MSSPPKSSAINIKPLVSAINSLASDANKKIDALRKKKDGMSVADMFELQAAMQKLAQFTEMSSSVLSSINSSMSAMARNIK